MRRPNAKTIAKLEQERQHNATRCLGVLSSRVRELLLAELSSRGHQRIGTAHSLVLQNMDLAGSSLTTITQRAGVSRQAINRSANELVRMGYLNIDPMKRDRRAKWVTLTPRGWQLVRDCLDAYHTVDALIESALGKRNTAKLLDALEVLLANDRCNPGRHDA